jgi:hypothetical protein
MTVQKAPNYSGMWNQPAPFGAGSYVRRSRADYYAAYAQPTWMKDPKYAGQMAEEGIDPNNIDFTHYAFSQTPGGGIAYFPLGNAPQFTGVLTGGAYPAIKTGTQIVKGGYIQTWKGPTLPSGTTQAQVKAMLAQHPEWLTPPIKGPITPQPM